MKSIKYLLVLLTIVFLSGCSKQHIENIVLNELNTNLFPFFNHDGLKQMKEHGIKTYYQYIGNDSYQVGYDINLNDYTYTILLSGPIIDQYTKDKNFSECKLYDDSTICEYDTYNIVDSFLKSIVDQTPLLIYHINFNKEYLETLKLSNGTYDGSLNEGNGAKLYTLTYENIDPTSDQNCNIFNHLIKTNKFTTLDFAYNDVYEENEFKYHTYGILYSGYENNISTEVDIKVTKD